MLFLGDFPCWHFANGSQIPHQYCLLSNALFLSIQTVYSESIIRLAPIQIPCKTTHHKAQYPEL